MTAQAQRPRILKHSSVMAEVPAGKETARGETFPPIHTEA